MAIFTASSHDDGDFTTDEVLDYYAHLARVPAIKGLPVGHTADKAFIPYGITAYLDATGPEASLSFQE